MARTEHVFGSASGGPEIFDYAATTGGGAVSGPQLASAISPGDNAIELSGLAKAFFYAGSKTLLVSHWAVPSEAAKRLTTGMFAALDADETIGSSEALRRSMLELIADDERI